MLPEFVKDFCFKKWWEIEIKIAVCGSLAGFMNSTKYMYMYVSKSNTAFNMFKIIN